MAHAKESDLAPLLARARLGDHQAFAGLIAATADDLRGFVAARAWNMTLAEEVVQDTYVSAFTHLANFQSGASWSAWLKGIARNRMHEALRRWNQRHMLPLGVAESLQAPASEEAEGLPELARLRVCLERLPASARRLLAERYWSDQSIARLADRHRSSVAAITQRLYRLREALRRCIGGDTSAI